MGFSKTARTLLLMWAVASMHVVSCNPSGRQKPSQESEAVRPEERADMRTHAFSKEQQTLIEATNAAVRDRGYDLKKFYVIYDEENALWRSSIKIPTPELDTHDYQLVIYAHRDKRQLGGDLWVLVDRDTRDILDFIVRQ